jgi:hypothetical protein
MFLFNRWILDAIDATKEGLHTIKLKTIMEVVMKLDLEKSYEKVNWNFLRLVLRQVGIIVEVINWIMGCVSLENFAVLINGYPLSFFKCYLGPKIRMFIVSFSLSGL